MSPEHFDSAIPAGIAHKQTAIETMRLITGSLSI